MATIGALPEMLQTAYGSLVQGLHLKKNDVLLIRGGSSTVGLMASVLVHHMGAKVISTSRNKTKLEEIKKLKVDYPVLDDKNFVKRVKEIASSKLDKVLELVGFSTLFQDMKLLKECGLTCFTGALGGQWTLNNFSAFMIPTGVFLTSYAGEAKDLPVNTFNEVLDLIKKGEMKAPIAKIYHGLESVGEAQANLESGKFSGKHVVVL